MRMTYDSTLHRALRRSRIDCNNSGRGDPPSPRLRRGRSQMILFPYVDEEILLVGATGLEPATTRPPAVHSTN